MQDMLKGTYTKENGQTSSLTNCAANMPHISSGSLKFIMYFIVRPIGNKPDIYLKMLIGYT